MDDQRLASETDTTSLPYVGEWNQLVSTTNWEKGRIISEWRDALIAADAAPQQYSDDAWSRYVGGVTPQHVGRLRRVYGRFGDTRETYAALFWSHFQAALDWDDAEMWLEGASQSKWSVSAMRTQRWQTLGALPADKPAESLPADLDEDFDPSPADATNRQSSTTDLQPEEREVQDDGPEEYDFSAAADNDEEGMASAAETDETSASSFRPFEDLPNLPQDLEEAFQNFKLAILRHKLAGWAETTPEDVALSLDALKQLLYAPEN